MGNFIQFKMKKNFLEVKFKNHKHKIPYYKLEGKKGGASIFISGGMHGDEVNGMYQIHRFLRWCRLKEIEKTMKGNIYVFPVLNVSGFQHNDRYVFEDGKDLNRSFGFKTEKSVSHAITNTLTKEIFQHCDLGIDIHDSGGLNELVPHTRIHLSEEGDCLSCTLELAKTFGLSFNLQRKGNNHMLAVFMKKKYNKSVLTVEIGGGHKIYENIGDMVIKGIENVLVHLGMFDGKPMKMPKQHFGSVRVYKKLEFPSIFKIFPEPGDLVEKGEKIGEIYDPVSGKLLNIISGSDGLLFSKSENNMGRKGEVIYSIIEDVKKI